MRISLIFSHLNDYCRRFKRAGLAAVAGLPRLRVREFLRFRFLGLAGLGILAVAFPGLGTAFGAVGAIGYFIDSHLMTTVMYGLLGEEIAGYVPELDLE